MRHPAQDNNGCAERRCHPQHLPHRHHQPLRGDRLRLGTEVQFGLTIAVNAQARERKTLGIDLKLDPLDEAEPTQSAQIAKRFAADASVTGIIGALKSSLANVGAGGRAAPP